MSKQLQLLVKDSSLELSKELLKPRVSKEDEASDDESKLFAKSGIVNGIFMPCINGNSRTLLLVRFTYRGIDREVVFDPRAQVQLRIPEDVM